MIHLQRREITAGKNVQLIPLFCHVLWLVTFGIPDLS